MAISSRLRQIRLESKLWKNPLIINLETQNNARLLLFFKNLQRNL
jgi:hypothetical protein